MRVRVRVRVRVRGRVRVARQGWSVVGHWPKATGHGAVARGGASRAAARGRRLQRGAASRAGPLQRPREEQGLAWQARGRPVGGGAERAACGTAGGRRAACGTAAAAPEGGGGAHEGDGGVAVELQRARHAATLDGEARAREERV